MADDLLPGDEWPEAPPGAVYHRSTRWWQWQGHGWTVAGVPPGGWPFVEAPFPRALYGPPGTVWTFDEADLFASFAGLPANPTRSVLNFALKKLGVTLGGETLLGWRTPDPPPQPLEIPMRWIHTTIIGKLGTDETVAHTFNWRTNPAPDIDMDAAAIATFAGRVRDAWGAFWVEGTSALSAQGTGAAELTYTEVRAAYLEQTVPAEIRPVPAKNGGTKKEFIYPRPTYLVPTQYATWASNAPHGAGQAGSLPFEVAMAVSLNTAQRGPRNRGRVFLGPFDRTIMGTAGNFDPARTQAIAQNFRTLFVNALNTNSGARLHVVSRAYATSEGVNAVRVGQVPDSQRRRRRSRPELYGALIAT